MNVRGGSPHQLNVEGEGQIERVRAAADHEEPLSIGGDRVIDRSGVFLYLKQLARHSNGQCRTQLNAGSHEKSIGIDEEQLTTCGLQCGWRPPLRDT